MATQFQANFGDVTAMTCTLASLATSADLSVTRQSTMVDNSALKWPAVEVFVTVTGGVNALAGSIVCYVIRGDGNGVRTDGAGAADAALTVRSAPVYASVVTPTNTTNGSYTLVFNLPDPGPEWGIAVAHSCSVAFTTVTAGTFVVNYRGVRTESV